jgi:hypothetical protein
MKDEEQTARLQGKRIACRLQKYRQAERLPYNQKLSCAHSRDCAR